MEKIPLINYYAGNGSSDFNIPLRKNKIDAKVLRLEHDLNAELDNLGSYDNSVVYTLDTCTHVSFDILAKWYEVRINALIQFPNFLSTTKCKWHKQGTWYKIKTSSASFGRDIEKIVGKHREKEVLFKSRATFVIKGIDYENRIILFVEIEFKGELNPIVLYDGVFEVNREIKGNTNDKIELSLSDAGEI